MAHVVVLVHALREGRGDLIVFLAAWKVSYRRKREWWEKGHLAPSHPFINSADRSKAHVVVFLPHAERGDWRDVVWGSIFHNPHQLREQMREE